MKSKWSVAIAMLVVAACSTEMDATSRGGGSGGGGGSPATGNDEVNGGGGDEARVTGLPCDVDAVLKANCQKCHAAQPQYGASTSLVTYDDLTKDHNGQKVYDLVKSRIHDDARPMPPSPNPRLSEKDLGAIDAWIAGGAKSSSDACSNGGPNAGDPKPLSCTPNTVLKATTPFTMKAGDPLDQYICVGVDVTLDKKRHITGLAPKVDNKKILHHVLLFQAPSSESSTPFACSAFGSASWKLVAGWAPGGNNLELPPEAGFPEEKGTTHWVIQLHYNNALNLTGATDLSGYELCTTEDLRANDAGVVAFGSTRFSIPPRSTTTIACDYKLPSSFQGVKLFNASPHMHTRGAAMSTEKLPGGTGTPEMVFEQKAFDFQSQSNYPIQGSVAPGDVMRTRCTWKNPGDTTIQFGEGTSDEMCFDFIGYYPNIPDNTIFGLPIFTWVTPSSSASCKTE
jgi:hypothetical protein